MTSSKNLPKSTAPKILINDFLTEYKYRGAGYEQAVSRVLKSGWYILGSEVRTFEKEFARFLGAKYCIGVASGMEALQISLLALGIKPGDEIITTPISAVATTLAVLAVGAIPVFSDVDQNGLLSPNQIISKITKKTKAILPVHLYGAPVNLEKIQKICQKYNLLLIEDACQAHGATFQGRKLGTIGDASAFSFYPTKNLGAFGDGGAIVTNSSTVVASCRTLRDYGQSSKYVHSEVGLNSRLDEIQAAILRTKLKTLKADNQKRQQLARRYFDRIKNNNKVFVINSSYWHDAVFHIFAIRTTKRNQLKNFLSQKGINSLIHYPMTIPDQPLFKSKYKTLAIPEARKFVAQTLTLPCHPWMTLKDVDYICDQIADFFDQSSSLQGDVATSRILPKTYE